MNNAFDMMSLLRSLLLLLLLLFGYTSLDARAQFSQRQHRAKTTFNLSITAGPTYNWLHAGTMQRLDPSRLETLPQDLEATQKGEDIEYPVRMGFNAGLFLKVSRGSLGLRAGATFMNTGALFDGTAFLNQDELDVNFVTVLLDVHLRKALGAATAYLFGGPELRYMLDLSDADAMDFATFRENLNPLSTTANLGAGLRLTIMGYTVGPEIRYAVDLTGISSDTFHLGDETFQFSDPYKLNNLHLGLIFGL